MSNLTSSDGANRVPPQRVRIRLGRLGVDPVTRAEALEEVAALISRGEGGYVFTPNVDHVVLVESDPEFRAAYQRARLSLVDGMPVLWASRLLGHPCPEKISGSDLIFPLMERATKEGWRVYLLGAGPGVAEEVGERLRRLFPGLRIVGASSPRVDLSAPPAELLPLIAPVKEAQAHLLLVALGSPKQEVFIHRVADELKATVAIGVGAGFDFIAGEQKRAPKWVSRVGMEWFYRLAQDPKRLWRRYLVRDFWFFAILLAELFARGPKRLMVRP